MRRGFSRLQKLEINIVIRRSVWEQCSKQAWLAACSLPTGSYGRPPGKVWPVKKDYPILVKMNCQDFVENGLVLEDAVQVGQMLAENGIDAIELSGGILTSRKLSPSRMGIKSEDREAYFQKEARAFKEKIDVPLIVVGGMRSFAVAEGLVNKGIADYISMSRPFIREPDLINRWKTGDLRKAACVSDNQCFGPGMKGVGIYCVTEEREKQKSIDTE